MWPKFSTVLFDHYIPSNNPEDYLASSQIQETFNIEETLKVDIQSKVWRYADKVYKHIFNKTLSELEVWTAKWNYFFQNSYDGVISELATARVVTINRIHAIETPYIKDEFSLLENNTKMNKTFFDNAHKLRMTMLDSHVKGNIRRYKNYPVVVDFDLVEFYEPYDLDYSPIYDMLEMDELGICTY